MLNLVDIDRNASLCAGAWVLHCAQAALEPNEPDACGLRSELQSEIQAVSIRLDYVPHTAESEMQSVSTRLDHRPTLGCPELPTDDCLIDPSELQSVSTRLDYLPHSAVLHSRRTTA